MPDSPEIPVAAETKFRLVFRRDYEKIQSAYPIRER
jgi:hypothetical protein